MTYIRLGDLSAAPRAARFLNLGTLDDLPADSSFPGGDAAETLAAVKEAGYEGVQGADPAAARDAGLVSAGGGRINTPGEALDAAKRWRDEGHAGVTVHAGWGMETDAEADALVGAIADASEATDLPVCVETHRATVTQDTRRTVDLVKRNPRLCLNADYSHWYTGLEMPYAGVEKVAGFLEPVFGRVGFLHGRIGNGCSMQVNAGRDLEHALTLPHVQHFVLLWTRTAAAFKANAKPGDVLPFAPELLARRAFYARVFPGPNGQLREETDRWQQALLLSDLFEHAFEAAG